LRKAIVIRRNLAHDFPAVPQYGHDLALSRASLSHVLVYLGRLDDAVAELRQAIGIEEQLAADSQTLPSYRRDVAVMQSNLGRMLSTLGRRDEAELACRKALSIQERLVADFPSIPDYGTCLGNSYCNMGDVLFKGGQAESALDWYGKALNRLQPIYSQDKRLVMAQRYLQNAHSGRARALTKLSRHAEAVRDLDRAIELDTGPDRATLRTQRAVCLVRIGNHDQAVAEANTVAQGKDVRGDTLYNAAGVFALASAAVKDDPKLADRSAARAIGLLRQAQAKGYFKETAKIEHMKKDTDLDPLRQRDDFKKLLADLEAKPDN
jgi:tetratricopeptide (TPR) repeat protein